MLDWSYNYDANNMYYQVLPTEIYVKNKQTYLLSTNNHNIYIYVCERGDKTLKKREDETPTKLKSRAVLFFQP